MIAELYPLWNEKVLIDPYDHELISKKIYWIYLSIDNCFWSSPLN